MFRRVLLPENHYSLPQHRNCSRFGFKFISEGLGLKVGFSDMYLQVGKLKETEAKHLGLKQNDPALRVETVFHLTNGQPFDFSKITYNYMQSQFLFRRIIIMGDERKKP